MLPAFLGVFSKDIGSLQSIFSKRQIGCLDFGEFQMSSIPETFRIDFRLKLLRLSSLLGSALVLTAEISETVPLKITFMERPLSVAGAISSIRDRLVNEKYSSPKSLRSVLSYFLSPSEFDLLLSCKGWSARKTDFGFTLSFLILNPIDDRTYAILYAFRLSKWKEIRILFFKRWLQRACILSLSSVEKRKSFKSFLHL